MPKKSSKNSRSPATDSASSSNDPMTACVELCQQQRWREALIVCKTACAKAGKKGDNEMAAGLTAASAKIEKAVRREIAMSVLVAARELLAKEYLLDVGE
jgi:hypothetical protein